MTITEKLLESIRLERPSVAVLSRRSGVAKSILSRFLRSERSISLETADRLAESLGLELHAAGPGDVPANPAEGENRDAP